MYVRYYLPMCVVSVFIQIKTECQRILFELYNVHKYVLPNGIANKTNGKKQRK